eukprot:4618483-Prymnesium_polylepis.1
MSLKRVLRELKPTKGRFILYGSYPYNVPPVVHSFTPTPNRVRDPPPPPNRIVVPIRPLNDTRTSC